MKRVKPLGDRVLVQPDNPEEVLASGIVIPPSAQEKPRQGRVLAVGPGLPGTETGERTPPTVGEGETVLFSQYGGIDVELNGTKLLLLREGDLLGTVEDE